MKDKVKKFWNQHGDVIVAVAYSAGLIFTSSFITASLTKTHCDAGWKVEDGNAWRKDDDAFIELHFKNGANKLLVGKFVG